MASFAKEDFGNFANEGAQDYLAMLTAKLVATITEVAADDERIAPIMRKQEHSLSTSRRRLVTVRSTNKLLGGDVDVRGGKTGFISRSGYCLATLLKLPQGDQVAVVVLGARSSAGRFMEVRHLFDWLKSKAAVVFTPKPPQE